MLSIAIICCGGITKARHAPAIARNPHVRVAGFYNRTVSKAEEMQALYGGEVYPTVEAVLADPAVDAVIVCSNAEFHKEHTIAALRAGKHVLCEKPMAENTPDALEMKKVAEETGKMLMISHNQRVYAPHVIARRLMREGKIGKVLTFKTSIGQPGYEDLPGGGIDPTIYDQKQLINGVVPAVGIHRIDLLAYLFDDEVDEVCAYMPTVGKTYSDGRPIDVEDLGMAMFKFKGGLCGTLWVTWNDVSWDRTTEIFGSEGVIKTYDLPHAVTLTDRQGNKTYFDVKDLPEPDHMTVTTIVDEFVDCVLHDKPPFVSPDDGLRTVRIMDAMRRSHERGCFVKVDESDG